LSLLVSNQSPVAVVVIMVLNFAGIARTAITISVTISIFMAFSFGKE